MTGKTDRGERLLERIRPVLLEILRGAPDYGAVAFEVTMHEGDPAFVGESRKAVHKIPPACDAAKIPARGRRGHD